MSRDDVSYMLGLTNLSMNSTSYDLGQKLVNSLIVSESNLTRWQGSYVTNLTEGLTAYSRPFDLERTK